jgi:triacylglycerol lipase
MLTSVGCEKEGVKQQFMSGISEFFEQQQQVARVPIWREAGLVAEWLRLKASPVFAGQNLPRGNGSAVITIPGFLCSDLYTTNLNDWLQRLGYRAYPSGLVRNDDCLEKSLRQVFTTIELAVDETDRKVHLIGHSLGGVIARIAAVQRPDLVSSIVTLGSPFRGIRAHSYILWLGQRVRRRVQSEASPHCFTGFCSCPSVVALQKEMPPPVRHCAIYTKADGIVDWRACIHDDPLHNMEVSGTHSGLVFNRQVYRFIGQWLAAETSTVEEA